MSAPRRIQGRRSVGWVMSTDAAWVGPGSRWGTPFHAVSARVVYGPDWLWLVENLDQPVYPYIDRVFRTERDAARYAVDRYRELWADSHAHIREALAGRGLACWCPLDQPCHADVLLEVANGGDVS